ncbi:hypothetical protein [Dyella sp.]|uniref:hypothetical protein n=1 Tax=Dyella sp. TaxID=1869338 RepID=UPI002B473F5C|nr:hypothetical protein [Dyella sp.]HKT28060.1 hypothetical protein [Dyella sp.]
MPHLGRNGLRAQQMFRMRPRRVFVDDQDVIVGDIQFIRQRAKDIDDLRTKMAQPRIAFLTIAEPIAQKLASKDALVIEGDGYWRQLSDLMTKLVRMHQRSAKRLQLRLDFDQAIATNIKPGIASQDADLRRLGKHWHQVVWRDKTCWSDKCHAQPSCRPVENFLGRDEKLAILCNIRPGIVKGISNLSSFD